MTGVIEREAAESLPMTEIVQRARIASRRIEFIESQKYEGLTGRDIDERFRLLEEARKEFRFYMNELDRRISYNTDGRFG
ncbi:MAG TPA: hypothetical protein VJA47_05700 [archaeon]|nr:hypothetical protein [archaeon]